MKRHGLAWADKCVFFCKLFSFFFFFILPLLSGSSLDDACFGLGLALGLSGAVLTVTSRDAIDEKSNPGRESFNQLWGEGSLSFSEF